MVFRVVVPFENGLIKWTIGIEKKSMYRVSWSFGQVESPQCTGVEFHVLREVVGAEGVRSVV